MAGRCPIADHQPVMPSGPEPGPAFSPRDEAEDITFAVEIKCLIRQQIPEANRIDNLSNRPGQLTDIRPFVPHQPLESLNSMTEVEKKIQRRTWAAVAMALHTLPGVEATTSHEIKDQNLGHDDFWKTHWIVYKANSAVPPYVSFVDGDADRPLLDATAPDFSKYVWIPMEVCSPKLYWARRGEALRATGEVCDTLRERFGAVANHSCEVHVHVGRHDGLYFSLRGMKRLATLLWLSEPILRSLKDPRSRNFDHTYTWSSAWRQHSRIAIALDTDRNNPGSRAIDALHSGSTDDLNTFLTELDTARSADGQPYNGSRFVDKQWRALGAIWRAANHEELGRMLCGPERQTRRLGFNFHSLAGEDERGRNSPKTIEFRFLEGFNESNIVLTWVQVCVGLMKMAVSRTDDGEFYDMVALLLDMPGDWAPDAKFAAVMDQLGLSSETYEPLRRIVRRNYPPD